MTQQGMHGHKMSNADDEERWTTMFKDGSKRKNFDIPQPYAPKRAYPQVDHTITYKDHIKKITDTIEMFQNAVHRHGHTGNLKPIEELEEFLKNHDKDRPKLTRGADKVKRHQERQDLINHIHKIKKGGLLAYNPSWENLYLYYEHGKQFAGLSYNGDKKDELPLVLSKIRFRQHIHLFREVRHISHYFNLDNLVKLEKLATNDVAKNWMGTHVEGINFKDLIENHITPLKTMFAHEESKIEGLRESRRTERKAAHPDTQRGKSRGKRGGRHKKSKDPMPLQKAEAVKGSRSYPDQSRTKAIRLVF